MSISRAQKMYNILPSLSTYYKYWSKHFKLQGKIPLCQSCCECCQNFEAVIEEMYKYMVGILCTLADSVDSSMCQYDTYFPKMQCILQKCENCSIAKLKNKLLQQNKDKLKDNWKWFLVKQWAIKTQIKNEERSSYLAWDHLWLSSYEQILDLYLK